MSELIERLRVAVITEVSPIDEISYITNLGEEAAGEIERLRAEIAAMSNMTASLTDSLNASTAVRGKILNAWAECYNDLANAFNETVGRSMKVPAVQHWFETRLQGTIERMSDAYDKAKSI